MIDRAQLFARALYRETRRVQVAMLRAGLELPGMAPPGWFCDATWAECVERARVAVGARA